MHTLEMEAPPKKQVGPSPENERMQQVRLALGYTDRTAFSTKVGIERSAYIKMESGPSRPSTESLLKIKSVFKHFNLNFIADPTAPILLNEATYQLPDALPPVVREGFPATPGTATPQEASFVGRYIKNLEEESAKKDELISWLQRQNEELLGKSPASAYAAAPEPPRTEISLRPEACRTEAKVLPMFPAAPVEVEESVAA